jgi:hypothetical protein
VYPGAPEATNFGEDDPGHVALVLFSRRRGRPRIERLRVARWRWEQHEVTSLAELRLLCGRTDLRDVVLRLRLDMDVTLTEEAEVERLLEQLTGSEAARGKVGVLQLHKLMRLRSDDRAWVARVPGILQQVAERIAARRAAPEGDNDDGGPDERDVALHDRALSHLYRLLRTRGAVSPGATDRNSGDADNRADNRADNHAGNHDSGGDR